MSTAPASCSELVRTYLEGGLPNRTTVAFTLDVYSLGPRVADMSDLPSILTLGYPPYPSVAGQLLSASTDSRGIRIGLDDGQLHAVVKSADAQIDMLVLGCVDANHLYGTTGDEMLGLGLGNPQPPASSSE